MRDRLATESPEEREVRLRQMRDRLAKESPEGSTVVAILPSMNGYLDAQMTRSRNKVFNHTHFITSIKRA